MNKPGEFQRILIAWYESCGSFRKTTKKKNQRNRYRETKKKFILTMKLNKNNRRIPAAKAPVAKSTLKVVISRSLQSNNPVWQQWTRQRDKLLNDRAGLSVSLQKQEMKAKLMDFMNRHRTHTPSFIKNKGLDSLQKSLHVWCGRSGRRRPNTNV